MDKDRIQGSVEQAKGKVKEVVGKVTGDAKLETEGKTQQTAGKNSELCRRLQGRAQGCRQRLTRSPPSQCEATSCLDGPRYAKAFLREGQRSHAVMCPAFLCGRTWTAGLDGFRGSSLLISWSGFESL